MRTGYPLILLLLGPSISCARRSLPPDLSKPSPAIARLHVSARGSTIISGTGVRVLHRLAHPIIDVTNRRVRLVVPHDASVDPRTCWQDSAAVEAQTAEARPIPVQSRILDRSACEILVVSPAKASLP